MSEFLGEERIRIRPDASGFRQELQAQIAGVLPAVQAQAAAASRLIGTAVGSATAAGLPASLNAISIAQSRVGVSAGRASRAQEALKDTNKRVGDEAKKLARNLTEAEQAAGRFTRGTFAAAAASTGLFRAVSFASGAFLVGAIAGGAIGAAVQEFKEMTVVGAQTAAVLRATGGVANVTAKQVDELAKSQLKLTGTDDELIKRAADVLLTFRSIRNESGAMNDIFTRSVKAVQDISAVFGTDLTGTAVQLGKALQDPVRGVTALRRSGITLSQSQRDLIKRLVESGRILTAQKVILGEVERQVGGTAAAIGRTLPGRLAVLRESAKNALGDYVKRVSESRDATEAFQGTMGGLGDALKTTFAIAAGAAGAFVEITRTFVALTHANTVFQSLGGLRSLVKTVTLAALAFGSLKLVLGAVTTAQRIYTRATTVATAATVAQGAAAATAGTRIGIGAAALGALRGPLGISIGITAATIGLIKLKQAADRMPGSFTAAAHALDQLGAAVDRVSGAKSERAAAGEELSIARLNQIAAQRAVAAAQRRLATTTAQAGSVQALALEDDLTRARLALRKATDELAAAQGKYADSQQNVKAAEQGTLQPLTRGTQAWVDRFKTLRAMATIKITPQQALAGPSELGAAFAQARANAVSTAVEAARRDFDKLAESGNKTDVVFARVIQRILAVGRLPTQKELRVALTLAPTGQSTREILAALGFGTLDVQRPAGPAAAQPNTAIQERRKALLGEIKRLQDLLTGGVVKETRGINEIVAARRQELAVARETVRQDRRALEAARDARENAIQGLADARRGLADAQRNLIDVIASSHQAIADAIRNSRQAVNDAVQSAKENLTSLGDSVAQTLGRFFTALSEGQTQGLTGKLGPQFRRLREEILAGGAGAGTQGRAQRLAAELAGQTSEKPVVDTDKIQRQFDDLTDAFNRGKINQQQFNKRLDNLLKGVDFNKVTRVLGSAAANQLRDWLRDLRQQARLNAESPQRAITRQLVNPLRAVADGAKELATARKQAARDIAAARQGIADADRGVQQAVKGLQRANQDLADAQRKLVRDQIEEGKKNRLAIAANTKQLKIRNDLDAARAKLTEAQKPKDKGKGAAANSSDALVGAGAASP